MRLTTDCETDTVHIDRKLQVNQYVSDTIGTVTTTSVYTRHPTFDFSITRSQHHMGPCHRPPRHLDNTFAPCGSNANWARDHSSRQSRHRWAPIGQHDLVMCRLSRPRHPKYTFNYYSLLNTTYISPLATRQTLHITTVTAGWAAELG